MMCSAYVCNHLCSLPVVVCLVDSFFDSYDQILYTWQLGLARLFLGTTCIKLACMSTTK